MRVARCSLCGETSQQSDDEEYLHLWRRAHLAFQHCDRPTVFGDTELVDVAAAGD